MKACARALACAVILILAPLPAQALEEAVYSSETFNSNFIYPNMRTYAPTPEGGTSWDEFAATTETPVAGSSNTQLYEFTVSESLRALEGTRIKMRGHMFVPGFSESSDAFLFGPFPATCPYHFHTPATVVIHVNAAMAVPVVYDSIIVEGRLEIAKPPAKEPYYTLQEATVTPDMPAQGPDTDKKLLHPLLHKRVPGP